LVPGLDSPKPTPKAGHRGRDLVRCWNCSSRRMSRHGASHLCEPVVDGLDGVKLCCLLHKFTHSSGISRPHEFRWSNSRLESGSRRAVQYVFKK
jgi:hypothetical protein